MSEYIVCPHCHNPLSQSEYVKVVRCRDCVYMTNRKYKNSFEYQTCSFFDSEYAEVEPNGFCAWGELMGDAE